MSTECVCVCLCVHMCMHMHVFTCIVLPRIGHFPSCSIYRYICMHHTHAYEFFSYLQKCVQITCCIPHRCTRTYIYITCIWAFTLTFTLSLFNHIGDPLFMLAGMPARQCTCCIAAASTMTRLYHLEHHDHGDHRAYHERASADRVYGCVEGNCDACVPSWAKRSYTGIVYATVLNLDALVPLQKALCTWR